MEIAVLVILALVIVGVVVWAVTRSRATTPRQPPPTQRRIRAEPGTVVLDVEGADPDNPYLEKLVTEVGLQALAADHSRDHVVVVGTDGVTLGRVERPKKRPPTPDLPPIAAAPHPRHGARPPGSQTLPPAQPAPLADAVPGRTFAERFDLPPAVTERIKDPDKPVDVVRAILEAAGHEVEVKGDVVRAGDEAVLVASDLREQPGSDAMSTAFLHYQASGAKHGIVISLGYVDPKERRRREILAPDLRHTGPEAIQRMGAAVAIGADPLRFAFGPPTAG